MNKDFDTWNKIKKQINNTHSIESLFFREKEVWWCACGLNIGFEQDGKGPDFRRPFLIVKKFNKYAVLAIPLTSKDKLGKYYLPCDLGDGILRKGIISQLRLIDTRRLIDKLGTLNTVSYLEIKKAIKDMV